MAKATRKRSTQKRAGQRRDRAKHERAEYFAAVLRKAGLSVDDYFALMLHEAEHGNTAWLAAHVRHCAGRRPLTVAQSEFLAGLLERAEGKRGKDWRRQVEKARTAADLKALEDEGLSPKAAISKIKEWRDERGLGRSTLYDLRDRESKKPK
jgi:hypothetical protein